MTSLCSKKKLLELNFRLAGYFDAAMKTALHLREYEDKLDPADIYSLLGSYSVYSFIFDLEVYLFFVGSW